MGLMACSTMGVFITLTTPTQARQMNQTMVTGPNKRPTLPVPFIWMENSPIRMPMVMGTMKCSKLGVAILMPSTADSTEIAGVMMASP